MPQQASAAGPDVESILTSISETVYRWDLRSDQMIWGSDAEHVLNLPDIAAISTGSAYGMLIDADFAPSRYAAIAMSSASDEGAGVPYRVKYRLLPKGRREKRSMWVEEHGRWFAGANGQPEKAAGVVRVINDRHEEEQKLLFLSGHDSLTGQINRARLTEVVTSVLENTSPKDTPAAFLMVAIDNLTLINETFGFHIGDEVIVAVGRRLRAELRDADSIGRYSSNKFGVVVHGCGVEELDIISTRMLDIIKANMVTTSVAAIPVTISIGAVRVPMHAKTVQDVIGHALEALDQAKSGRTNNYILYEPSEKKESARQRNAAITDEIIEALNERRMKLALQPIVDAKTGETVFHECLLRMITPTGDLVSAGEFIAVAEQLGLSRMIDQRVLELAIDLLRSGHCQTISMNVSSLTTTDSEWIAHFEAMTKSDPALRERIIVEITETVAIKDVAASIAFVERLKALGCRVAIDDFGAGYTSYRNIKLLDVDILKIDGSFVKNLMDNADDQIFIRNLTELAQNFKLETVAEWVEDAETASFLAGLGITYLQGYHTGAPELPECSYHRDKDESDAAAIAS